MKPLLQEKPGYLSYSQFSTYLECQYKWFLTRVLKVDEEPAVWLPAGTALHAAADSIDRELIREQEVPF